VARNKLADVVVRITTGYGCSYEEKKDEFISELHELSFIGKALLLLVGILILLDLN
jgi:hypothetical protein